MRSYRDPYTIFELYSYLPQIKSSMTTRQHYTSSSYVPIRYIGFNRVKRHRILIFRDSCSTNSTPIHNQAFLCQGNSREIGHITPRHSINQSSTGWYKKHWVAAYVFSKKIGARRKSASFYWWGIGKCRSHRTASLSNVDMHIVVRRWSASLKWRLNRAMYGRPQDLMQCMAWVYVHI